MKNKMKHFGMVLSLVVLISTPMAAQATVVRNLEKVLTDLLGHAPEVMNIGDTKLRNALDKAEPAHQPWSGSYWPDITGGIVNHYLHRSFIGNFFFFFLRYGISKHRFLNDHNSVKSKYARWALDKFNRKLSPSEKYDLLLGDTNFTFTENIIKDLQFRATNRRAGLPLSDEEQAKVVAKSASKSKERVYADDPEFTQSQESTLNLFWKKANDAIAYWFGICDGWSPAAVSLPRPLNPVVVMGAPIKDSEGNEVPGLEITFYPDDLKALGSYVYARTNNDNKTTLDYHWAGTLCKEKGDPELESDDQATLGWVKDLHCNDVDPAVWHLTLLNRVGKDRLGFVFEVDNNRKVNNHPVAGYEITYFNPVTGKEGTFNSSRRPIHEVHDVYASRRNENTRYLVGVKSKFNYLNYQWPESHHNKKWAHDHAGQDNVKDKEYVYDLELDEENKVLGGEWGDRSDDRGSIEKPHRNKARYAEQPDFIWMPAPYQYPNSDNGQIWNRPLKPGEMNFSSFGTVIDPNSKALFGNMRWQWDGVSAMPDEWLRGARQDVQMYLPKVGKLIKGPKPTVEPIEALSDNMIRSAQPLSNIVYYLFDRSQGDYGKGAYTGPVAK